MWPIMIRFNKYCSFFLFRCHIKHIEVKITDKVARVLISYTHMYIVDSVNSALSTN